MMIEKYGEWVLLTCEKPNQTQIERWERCRILLQQRFKTMIWISVQPEVPVFFTQAERKQLKQQFPFWHFAACQEQRGQAAALKNGFRHGFSLWPELEWIGTGRLEQPPAVEQAIQMLELFYQTNAGLVVPKTKKLLWHQWGYWLMWQTGHLQPEQPLKIYRKASLQEAMSVMGERLVERKDSTAQQQLFFHLMAAGVKIEGVCLGNLENSGMCNGIQQWVTAWQQANQMVSFHPLDRENISKKK